MEFSECDIMSSSTNDYPETELCRLEIEGPVARITLSRPDVFNALNVQLISELIEILHWTSNRSVLRITLERFEGNEQP